MEAEQARKEADEAAVNVDESSSPTAGRRFTRA